MKTATLIRVVRDTARGEQRLYRLSEPLIYKAWDEDEEDIEYEHVVVSAADVMFSGPETYIFGSDNQGKILDWGELDGSFRGQLDHAEALWRAGYRVAEEV